MAKRTSHRKAAADEAKKAALDAASVVFPDLSKARSIIGVIDHGEKAIQHGRKAVKSTVRSRINRIKKALGLKPKRKPTTKTRRKKTTARRKR